MRRAISSLNWRTACSGAGRINPAVAAFKATESADEATDLLKVLVGGVSTRG
jgi:hypothetical protein